MSVRSSLQGVWTRSWVSFLAVLALSLGLGNIWTLPQLLTQYGGSAALLVYLVTVLLVSYPLVLSEQVVGRFVRRSPALSVWRVAKLSPDKRYWKWLSLGFLFIPLLLVPINVLIGGWLIEYLGLALLGNSVAITPDQALDRFTGLVFQEGDNYFLMLLFVLPLFWVLAGGVVNGLARTLRFLIPAVFVLTAVMLVYSLLNVTEGFSFEPILSFRPEQLGAEGLLLLLQAGLFSSAAVCGGHMVVAAYIHQDVSLFKLTGWALFVDLLITLLLLVVVMILGFNPDVVNSGVLLLFVDLPVSFGHLPGGQVYGFLFFILALLMLWSSAWLLAEVWVARLLGLFGLSRIKSALCVSMVVFLLAVGVQYSMQTELELRVYEAMNQLLVGILVPMMALLFSLFAARVIGDAIWTEELSVQPFDESMVFLRRVLMLVIPLVVVLIFLLELKVQFG